ncbi:MAG: alpha/beta hydrolase [Leptospiraceae bacterium]|nr:alpha/beta hydrolase [Leptospiraceae bacterium]
MTWRAALAPALFPLLLSCIDFHRSKEQIHDALSGRQVQEATLPSGAYSIHTLAVGPSTGRPVLFIHGSPGSWDNYLDVIGYLDSSSEPTEKEGDSEPLLLIFYDRPGFSRTSPSRALPDLKGQAEAARTVLQHYSSRPAITVGHSYGGPVAMELALMAPEAVSSLVLIGASVDPSLEELRWYNYAAQALSPVLPTELVNSNEEMLPVKADLKKQEETLKEARKMPPVYVLHGTDDSLVPVENVNYIYSMLKGRSPLLCIRTLRGEDHFIPWTDARLLAETVREAQSGRCEAEHSY